MQEYDFFNALGNGAKNFWAESEALALANNTDGILAYMMLMIERAKTCKVKTTRSAFREYGRVNFISQADYTSGSRLHKLVKIILEKIAADAKYLSFPNAKLAK